MVRAGLHAARQQLANDRVLQMADGCTGGSESEERWWALRVRHHHRQGYGVDRDVEQIHHELLGVECAVAEEHVERPLLADRDDIVEVVLDLADEELVEVEGDALRPFQCSAPGEQVVEVTGHHLCRPLVREPRHVQAVDPGAVRRTGVPAHVMPAVAEMDSDPRKRVEVAVCRQGCEQDLHHHLLTIVTL